MQNTIMHFFVHFNGIYDDMHFLHKTTYTSPNVSKPQKFNEILEEDSFLKSKEWRKNKTNEQRTKW